MNTAFKQEMSNETCSHWGYTFTSKNFSWGSDDYEDYTKIRQKLMNLSKKKD